MLTRLEWKGVYCVIIYKKIYLICHTLSLSLLSVPLSLSILSHIFFFPFFFSSNTLVFVSSFRNELGRMSVGKGGFWDDRNYGIYEARFLSSPRVCFNYFPLLHTQTNSLVSSSSSCKHTEKPFNSFFTSVSIYSLIIFFNIPYTEKYESYKNQIPKSEKEKEKNSPSLPPTNFKTNFKYIWIGGKRWVFFLQISNLNFLYIFIFYYK